MNFIDFACADPYVGPLFGAALDAGVEALENNAERLARDARLLLLARRHASAAMMGAMAIAELARISCLFELAARDEAPALGRAWRQLRSADHAFPWLIFQTAAIPVRDDELKRIVAAALRLSRGADCVEPGNWASPDDLLGR